MQLRFNVVSEIVEQREEGRKKTNNKPDQQQPQVNTNLCKIKILIKFKLCNSDSSSRYSIR